MSPVNPVVPSTYELRSLFEIGAGQTMVQTINVERGGVTLTSALATTLAGILTTAWGSNLQTAQPASTVYESVTVTDLNVANGPQFVVPVGTAGLDGGQPLPNQTSALIVWRTNTRGPSYRGRTFWGGFAESASDGSGPGSSALAALNSWAAAVMAAFTTATHQMVVVSRYEHNPSPPPISIPRATNITTAITSGVADTFWKTLRSRAPIG